MLYIEIFLVAISLSLDAFSLALSIGLRNISKKEIKTYSVVVGLYHFIMPLMGFFMRLLINNFFTIPNKIIFISVIVFIIIGILIDKDKEINIISPIIFGFTVSIDSFSIGISLSKSYLLISILQFSIISSLLTYIGFKIADKMKLKFKNKSKYISISILIFILIYNIIK